MAPRPRLICVREGIGAGGEFGLELVQQVPALCRCHLERRGDVREAGDASSLSGGHPRHPLPGGRAQPVRSAWSPSTHRPASALAGWRRTWEASMYVSWVVVRRLVVGLVLVVLAFLGLEVSLFLLTALFLD